MNHPLTERPDTGNYFRFYGLEEKFALDPALLKSRYLEKSRQFHPDFYGSDPESHNLAVAISAFNNQAFQILNNDVRRAQYLVELNAGQGESNAVLPQEFLMEMMELNEAIDEMDETSGPQIRTQLKHLSDATLSELRENAGRGDWHETEIAVLKWKYLERLEGRLT